MGSEAILINKLEIKITLSKNIFNFVVDRCFCHAFGRDNPDDPTVAASSKLVGLCNGLSALAKDCLRRVTMAANRPNQCCAPARPFGLCASA